MVVSVGVFVGLLTVEAGLSLTLLSVCFWDPLPPAGLPQRALI